MKSTTPKPGPALITGASAGIGKELARLHAARGGEVILVARRRDALEELAQELEREYGVVTRVMPADLADLQAVRGVHSKIEEAGLEVEVLINNAGFGGHGAFHEKDVEGDLKMVDLNVKSLMLLTHLVVQGMVARRRGRILNVGSTAGMIPAPLQATYHASKAFVNSFSQALAKELEGHGITVTLLAPGPVATEFFDVANMSDVKGIQKNQANAADVARVGYEAMERGKLFVYNDPKLRIALEWLMPFLPRRQVLSVMRDYSDKSN